MQSIGSVGITMNGTISAGAGLTV